MKTRGVLLLFGLSFVCVGAAEGGPLRVGAARVDITPAPGAANVKTTGRGVDPQRAKGRHLSRTPRRAGPTPRSEYRFSEADPVNIRLALLTINDVALAGVSGEVFTLIARRLQRESPSIHAVMVTHTNGASGYIPDDATFGPVSYEVTASRLKPGCAEGAIVNGFLELIGRR